jgi:hypothetical protein
MTSIPPPSWRAQMRASPELYPLDLDPVGDGVTVLKLARVDYERASFLDARLERPPAMSPSFAELTAAAEGLPVACDFIFHVGHVGSTLMSRLLGFHPRVFSLREPQALRTFARVAAAGGPWSPAEAAERLQTFLALYSRVWTPAQRSLIKATSVASELAASLLELAPGSRALAMTVAPAIYIATILGGPNSRVELRMAASGRLARLARRLDAPLAPAEGLSEGELAAMSWACEMTALAGAAAAFPDRVSWVDFDCFLADPAGGLAAALAALHGAAEPEAVARLMGSGFLERYSKAPTYAYGPQVRREVLAQAEAEAGDEIRRGLDWLGRQAQHPAVATALATAEAARAG